jgi:proteasome lid subunit RPN8/RPN11
MAAMAELQAVVLPAALHGRLLSTVVERYPRKSFGYLVSAGPPEAPSDFVLFSENIRNDPRWRPEFESRGRYFVDHPDAGFVATPEESWQIQRMLRHRGVREVGVFHTHRRHPGSLSRIDYDLHVSRFGRMWHMIISLRNPRLPQLRAFDVSSDGVRELPVGLG